MTQTADLIDENEAARRLGLNVLTLRRWRWAKTGLAYIKIGRSVRYRPDDVENLIQTSRVTTAPVQTADQR